MTSEPWEDDSDPTPEPTNLSGTLVAIVLCFMLVRFLQAGHIWASLVVAGFLVVLACWWQLLKCWVVCREW